ncbi:MAG: hypothetical protein WDM96_02705 [Lacunisphaera sp.]
MDVTTLSPAALADALAWRQGQVIFNGTPLREALARFARYHGRSLTASDEAAHQRVGGRRSLDDHQRLPVRSRNGRCRSASRAGPTDPSGSTQSTADQSRSWPSFLVFLRRLTVCLAAPLAAAAAAKPVDFNLPAGPATQSLLAFSQQARVEVLFSFDELKPVETPAVQGTL